MRRRHTQVRRHGLTLMEVMLVLVILGILGSMAAMFITTAREDALRKVTKAEIDTLITACDRYTNDMFSEPPDLQALLSPPSSDQNNRWAGPYIKPGNDLKDPWLNDYQFTTDQVSGTNKMMVVITSAGPDGSIGSQDDIASTDEF